MIEQQIFEILFLYLLAKPLHRRSLLSFQSSAKKNAENSHLSSQSEIQIHPHPLSQDVRIALQALDADG